MTRALSATFSARDARKQERRRQLAELRPIMRAHGWRYSPALGWVPDRNRTWRK